MGAGFYVRGSAEVAPPPSLRCVRCSCAVQRPLTAEFEVYLADKLGERPRRRRRGKTGAARHGSGDVGTAGAADGTDVLLFPPHASAVDLTPLVRDCLVVALPPAQSCEACAAAAAAAAAAQSKVKR